MNLVSKKRKIKRNLIIAITFILVIIGVVSYNMSVLVNKQTNTCLVTGKESVYLSGTEGHEYRIYTTCGTYVITDSLMLLRFNTADMYGKVVVNNTYSIYSGGYRIPFLSVFPNIISISTEAQLKES